MTKKKKIFAALIMMVVFAATAFSTAYLSPMAGKSAASARVPGGIREVTDEYKSLAYDNLKFGDTVLTEAAKKEENITFIASLCVDSVLDVAANKDVDAIIGTARYNDAVSKINKEQNKFLRSLKKAGIKYSVDGKYDTVISGVAVTIATEDFAQAEKIAENMGGTAIISETYNEPQTVASPYVTDGVTVNDVNVYETGIFDSSDIEYQGDGTIIAVLDSGFDYTHTAFTTHMPTGELALTRSQVQTALSDADMKAKALSPTVTAADVYVSDKIPFAYDYADHDADVYPLESSHGTHVASIIAGRDEVITGVAPAAQLALMKVFSDVTSGAKTTVLLNALDDCVKLGVDVVNMSLGMSCGFAREKDEKGTDAIYDALRDAGISIICAASNDYNSTYGSEANGNLPLTTNPDSATVGSPSTYAASLSVASISGVKTSYLEYNGSPIYYKESSNTAGEQYNFVDIMLGSGNRSGVFEYITIAGVGESANYLGIDVKGKIALVRRGKNSFEEKVQAAYLAGAAGVIVYNNVSGDIGMSVGNYLKDWGVGCISISQDDGEKLAAQPSGKISISRDNLAGPFMSDFSSWGPTPDLGIKPEITAHGGDILAAIPGQRYDRLSGTSMASPNQAGVHALVRQYIKSRFFELFPGLDQNDNEGKQAIAALANQLLMSTTDIARDEFGNPYAVRKQGAGLANLKNATETRSIITVKAASGETLDRTKLELGDDLEETGVYTLKFTVKNIADTASSFDIGALVYTESVSKTLTDKDKTVSSERAYMLSDTAVKAEGAGVSGNIITVAAKSETDVTVTLTLSDSSKEYIRKSFANGMYVEGFVCLNATDGGVNLNAPFLAFFGDWTKAPLYDLTYFETNPDEINNAIDDIDKTKPDAWATRPIGKLYKDYISYLGGYYFTQNPSDVQIPASEEHIALTNNEDGVGEIHELWAGLLRNAKETDITITDKTTGRVIFEKTETNNRKAHNYGSAIYYGTVEVGFKISDYNLKNNTMYSVRFDSRLDFERSGENTNLKNSYEFDFTTDFEAPKITDIRYYSEYDDVAKETNWYADVDIYDNHYAQSIRPLVWQNGGMVESEYNIPVYGEKNSISTVTIDLNQYLSVLENGGQFLIFAYDYAMNSAVYEITLPEEVNSIALADSSITISQYETKLLQPSLYPEDAFSSMLDYKVENGNIAKVVNGTVVGLNKGTTTVTVSSRTDDVSQKIKVTVLGAGDPGYRRYDRPTVNEFDLLGYSTDMAYYERYTDERNIGITGNKTLFESRNLTMFPGESISLMYDLKAYFPEETQVLFTSSRADIAKVDEHGKITALSKGRATITARVWAFGSQTMHTQSVTITVEDPYVTSGGYLTKYKGIGEDLKGNVKIPEKLNLTEIAQFAFSLSQTVDKDPSEITEDDPSYTTSGPRGEERTVEYRIKSVEIPEGVEVIDQYAFANMTALETVYLPKSLRQINNGAFSGCTALTSVIGLENVQIISENAFSGCEKLSRINKLGAEKFRLDEAIAIGKGAFANTGIKAIELPKVQSIGIGAFYSCDKLESVGFGTKVKLDSSVFAGCTSLKEIEINAPVISDELFFGSENLSKLVLGPDVAEIGVGAFAGTQISEFEVSDQNKVFYVSDSNKGLLLRDEGKTLAAVAPKANFDGVVPDGIDRIGNGAFSCFAIDSVTLNAGTYVDDYAFRDTQLKEIIIKDGGKLAYVGKGAFMNTAIAEMPAISAKTIGEYAFAGTMITTANIDESTTIGKYAFAGSALHTINIGENSAIDNHAFDSCFALKTLNFTGSKTTSIGDYAFFNCPHLATITGSQYISKIGDYAFFGESYITQIEGVSVLLYATPQFVNLNLSGVEFIGKYAFAENIYLKNITVSDKLTKIDDYAFYAAIPTTIMKLNSSLATVNIAANCTLKCAVGNYAFFNTSVSDFAPFENVVSLGDFAFAFTSVNQVDLGNIDKTGEYAFAYAENLAEVTLNTSADKPEVKKGVFLGAEKLNTVRGLNKTVVIGARAFMNTALIEVDLTDAEYIGAQAFAQSAIISVKLGDKLKDLGDNPFAYTNLPVFSKADETADQFGRPYINYNYDISDTVKVINGALYVAVPAGGLELITYSAVAGEKSFTVANGTIRISDYAAAGNGELAFVYLPETLKSIGAAAFADCDNLSTVNFGSIVAPVLEAEYNERYIETNENGNVTNSAQNGLGMTGSKYASEYLTDKVSVMFNANFKDYIGTDNAKGLIMTYPKNGVGYNSFVYNNYFDYKIVTAVVAEEFTKSVVEKIAALPASITLDDEAAVAAARLQYDQISSAEQKALVSNYETLVNAELRIETLKSGQTPTPTPEPVEEDKKGMNGGTVVLIIITVVLAFGCIALATVFLLPVVKKKFFADKEEDSQSGKEEAQVENAEQNDAVQESAEISEKTEEEQPQTISEKTEDEKSEIVAESEEVAATQSEEKAASESAPKKKSAGASKKTGSKKSVAKKDNAAADADENVQDEK